MRTTRRIAATLGAALVITFLAPAALVARPLGAQQRGFDVVRYRFAITLPDVGPRIEVTARVDVRRQTPATSFVLDLLAPMQVESAAFGCGAQPASIPFTHDGRRVTLTLPEIAGLSTAPPIPGVPVMVPNDTSCLTLRYAGAPADGLIIGADSARRWRAFADNWPDRARHWLASVDHPSDKALVEFVVNAPASLEIVSNGTRRDVTTDRSATGGAMARRRTTWATSLPIPTYLMVIAAAPLTETKLGDTACGLAAVARCVPQTVYTAPEQARYLPGNFAKAGAIVEFFARTIAPFPYEQLAHLQSSTRFGGMENAGAIFYADALFRRPEGVPTSLIAHEVAHQWFGDAVTGREWGHLWLSEGFATYFAALYTEHAEGDSAFRATLAGIRRQVLDAPVVLARPVLDSTQTDLMQLLNANSYQKGGLVLHMLRRELGDSAFFVGVREYYANGRHANAQTSDLRLSMERASRRDLGWFFDQWLRRPGFIDAQVTWRHDAATQTVILTVTQGTRFRPYRFKLPLEIEASDGTRRVVEVEVPAQGRVQTTLRETFASAPAAVRPDPGADLLANFRAP